ncbi:unnamed protein product, partial [Brenthis ino]
MRLANCAGDIIVLKCTRRHKCTLYSYHSHTPVGRPLDTTDEGEVYAVQYFSSRVYCISKMFLELPQFAKCCFCMPLRGGVLTFGYLKMPDRPWTS